MFCKRALALMLTASMALLAMSGVAAQTAETGFGSIAGLAYDSLRNQPIADAQVWVEGRAGFVLTDAKGQFKFDSVAPGTHTLLLVHPSLDSLGLPELTARVNVQDGAVQQATIALSGFTSWWRRLCGGAPPADSGVVFGAIVDAANGQRVAGAPVTIRWIDIVVSNNNALSQRRFALDTQSDSSGVFAACGVPLETPMELIGNADRATQIVVPVYANARRVLQQPLMIMAQDTAVVERIATPGLPDSTVARDTTVIRSDIVGTVRGRVIQSDLKPIDSARVVVDGVGEGRTNAEGRFEIRGIPAGTRLIEISAIGSSPFSRTIDVPARDTVIIDATLQPATALAAIETRANRESAVTRDMRERRMRGFGYSMDSTTLQRIPSLTAMLNGFPSVVASGSGAGVNSIRIVSTTSIVGGSGSCEARVFIDGRPSDVQQVNELRPSDLAWIEVYTRPGSVPLEFQMSKGCGAVAVFTKQRYRP